MELHISECSAQDVETLVALAPSAQLARHHRERYEFRVAGTGADLRVDHEDRCDDLRMRLEQR